MDEDYWNIYRHLDIDHNIELGEDAEHPSIIHEGFGKISELTWIERFVKACINSKSLPDFSLYSMRDKPPLKGRSLTSFYPLMNAMIGTYDEYYFYSPRVEAFFQACVLLSLTTGQFSFERNALETEVWTGKSSQHTFHALIEHIRHLCGKRKFKRRLRRHERSVRRRAAKVLIWEKRIFDKKSRHLIIPLTLEYKPEFRLFVTPELIQKHLRRLLNNRRANSLLAGIKDYVWRIEEGDRVGLHIHLLVAYDGASWEDMSISKSICEYWDDIITKGAGHSKSASMFKLSDSQGTYGAAAGQINRGDCEKRRVLREALLYLVKADQFLKRKSSAKFKTFGMSQPSEHSGMGRPRKSLPSNIEFACRETVRPAVCLC